MRKPLIAGNWKMNGAPGEARELVGKLIPEVTSITDIDIVVCPPFIALDSVYELIKGTNVRMGAQNLFWEKEGAYTGEISPGMLREVGCHYVIIGHSERRTYFGEIDETVNKKIDAALRFNLIPIVCVGETLEEREKNVTRDVVERQITAGLSGFTAEQLLRTVIAYEPIWAIGTGRTATPEQANEVHSFIRALLASKHDQATAEQVRILYGGSVKPENASKLMHEKDIDGALVGGASLDAESFARIIKYNRSQETTDRG